MTFCNLRQKYKRRKQALAVYDVRDWETKLLNMMDVSEYFYQLSRYGLPRHHYN